MVDEALGVVDDVMRKRESNGEVKISVGGGWVN